MFQPQDDKSIHKHGWHVEPKYPVLHTRQLLGVAQLLIVLLSQWSMQMYGSQVRCDIHTRIVHR
jgi:hypothetical protein